MVVTFVLLLVLIYLVLRIKSRIKHYAKDGFGITTEFKMMGYGVSISAAATLLLAIASWLANSRVLANDGLRISAIFAVAVVWLSISVYPLHLRRVDIKNTKLRRLTIRHASETLSGLLASPILSEAFVEFCVREFNPESYYFWRRTEDFRQHVKGAAAMYKNHVRASDAAAAADPERIATLFINEVDNVYQTFVCETAPFQINIAQTVRVGTRDRIHAASLKLRTAEIEVAMTELAGVFDEAARVVFHLMENNSYRRFLNSAEYRNIDPTTHRIV